MRDITAVTQVATRLRKPAAPMLTLLGLLFLGGGIYLYGADFYGLALAERVEHEDYATLRPSGLVGHGYGFAGTLLILTNLLYLVRRRFARFRLGSMEAWLNLHVFTGLAGGLLILFHSAFQIRSPVAVITAVSLFIAILTGVFGRVLVAFSFTTDAVQLAANLSALDELVPGLGGEIRKVMAQRPPTQLKIGATLLRSLATVPTWMREARQRKRLVREIVRERTIPRKVDAMEQRVMRQIVRRTASMLGAEVRGVAAATLLRGWRGFHRFFAILMIVAVSLHIGVAWYYGYRWILSES